MKIIDKKKFLFGGLMSILALAFVAFAPPASANSDHHHHHDHHHSSHHSDHHNSNSSTPRLYSITSVANTSVVLPVKYDRFKGQTLNAIVSVKNDSAGTLIERSYKVALDNDGNGSIKVGSLMSNTKYSFKVRIINPNSGNSSDNSSSKDVTTS